jgi:hypothetical protein
MKEQSYFSKTKLYECEREMELLNDMSPVASLKSGPDYSVSIMKQ